MKTRILTKEQATIVRNNCRWFAGWKFRIKKLATDRYQVTMPFWQWSHFVL